MLTEGVTVGVIIIVILLDVTGFGLAQGAFEVSTQVTISPCAGS